MFRRTRSIVATALLLSACGGSGLEPTPEPEFAEGEPTAQEEEPVSEDDLENDASQEEECDVSRLESTLEYSPGGLVSLELPEGLELQDVIAPETWRPRGDARFRTPYGSGEGVLTLDVSCGDTSRQVDVTTVPKPLSWTEIVSDEGPAAREHTVMWIDPSAPDSLYVYGGYLYEPAQFTAAFDMWRLDLEAGVWTEVSQVGDVPATTAGEIALMGEDGVAVHVGGTDIDGEMPSSVTLVEVDGDAADWSEVDLGEGELGLQLGAFAYDAERDRHLWVSGLVNLGDGMTILPSVVALAFEHLDAAAPAISAPEMEEGPSLRYGSAWTIDPVADRLVLFAGAQVPADGDPVNAASDTWAMDLTGDVPTWTRLSPGGDAPVARRNGCFAYDRVGHRLFVFGGTADGRTSVQGLHVLSLDEGEEEWKTLEVVDGPDARASCTGVYDVERERVLFGFGNNSYDIYSDVWALQL